MENLGLLVYFYGIYDNVMTLFVLIAIISLVASIAIILFINVGECSGSKKWVYFTIPLFIACALLKTAMPSKEYLPLIVGIEPITKQILESAKDGKLNKLNIIIDKTLDKSIKILEGE